MEPSCCLQVLPSSLVLPSVSRTPLYVYETVQLTLSLNDCCIIFMVILLGFRSVLTGLRGKSSAMSTCSTLPTATTVAPTETSRLTLAEPGPLSRFLSWPL